ncbi:MAG: hypothetical protein H7A23_16980 [Leptospiraceae bacterium]|nr:hypothetical protein [Leptospiraceae bacterium]MCP5496242.1 hypothetical protein [Leptospiraceae bacterium]
MVIDLDMPFWQQIQSIIEKKIGIDLSARVNREHFESICKRSNLIQKLKKEEYIALLETANPSHHPEWVFLLDALNVSESFFFRDKKQLELIENLVLPDLVRQKNNLEIIKVWSAGCSTGQEPYTLAIIIEKIKRVFPDSKFIIYASDINFHSIKIAAEAVYHPWSVRISDPVLLDDFFEKKGEKLRFKSEKTTSVHFELTNLISDPFPKNFDLILCRNVFIYMKQEYIQRVIEKFSESINPNGYLLIGHAEYTGKMPKVLETMLFANSVIYKKVIYKSTPSNLASENSTTIPKAINPTSIKAVGKNESIFELETRLEKSCKAGNQNDILEIYSKIPSIEKLSSKSLLCFIKSFMTNQKQKAIPLCEYWIEREPLNTQPYFLLAQIFESIGKFDSATESYKKVIYLNPTHKESIVSLYQLYKRNNDLESAMKVKKMGSQFF